MKKKLLLLGIPVLLILIIIYGWIQIFCKGTYLWGLLTPHSSIQLSDFDSVTRHNDNYETGLPNGASTCYERAYYTESELFGKDCHFIFYGKVTDCTNYVYEKYSQNYSFHIITLRVKKGIYGGLNEGQTVHLLCRWRYSEKLKSSLYIPEESEGIFITYGTPVKIHLNQSGKNIMAIGRLRHNLFYHCCLTTQADGLEALKSRKDVIAFWKKKGWLSE